MSSDRSRPVPGWHTGLVGFAFIGDASPNVIAAIQAFAAGDILTMLADTMMPEAFEHGSSVVGQLRCWDSPSHLSCQRPRPVLLPKRCPPQSIVEVVGHPHVIFRSGSRVFKRFGASGSAVTGRRIAVASTLPAAMSFAIDRGPRIVDTA